MNHLENISKLFSKDFVESPLLETFDAGKLYLPTGQLVACDPLVTSDMPAFTQKFPTGAFPIFIHKERESNCVAYVEIVFSQTKAVFWEMATIDGQIIADLKEEEIFGYPVESGMGCFMDADTQNELSRLEQRIYKRKGVDFMGLYEEFFHAHFFDENGAIDQFALLKPLDTKPGNIFAFETGYGEGFFGSYIGFDEQNVPIKVITEFIEIGS